MAMRFIRLACSLGKHTGTTISKQCVFTSCHLGKTEHRIDASNQRTIVNSAPRLKKAKVSVTFIKRNGEPVTVSGKEDSSLLDIAVDNDLDLEGFGICEGTVSCSTCHVILKPDDYERLPDKPGDEEKDMLDMAIGYTDTSRLGCQVIITKEMDGLIVKLPSEVSDARNQ